MTESGKITDYRPISCAAYSTYEVAIMHRQRLHLVWAADNVVYTRTVLPTDLKTESGEEFLICQSDTGESLRLRLDQIRKAEPA